MFEFEGATVTAMRPKGFSGKPLFAAAVTSVQCAPPSPERYRPLPDFAVGDSPPERNVQPLRRKSQRPAKMTSGWSASMLIEAQPVDRLPPLSTRFQCAPPSGVLYRPRSAESLHSLPGTQA